MHFEQEPEQFYCVHKVGDDSSTAPATHQAAPMARRTGDRGNPKAFRNDSDDVALRFRGSGLLPQSCCCCLGYAQGKLLWQG